MGLLVLVPSAIGTPEDLVDLLACHGVSLPLAYAIAEYPHYLTFVAEHTN